MAEILEISIAEGIAEVRLNRPEVKNALSLEMFDALSAAGEGLATQAGLRAVILHGAGGDFCSGLDTSVMQSMATRMDEMRTRLLTPLKGGAANWFQKPCTVWQNLGVPVIAAIEGVCLGGGMQLALAADFRVAAADARLSIMEAKWGLIPDMGISQSLPKLMRADQAKELMMTARIFSGDEALEMGLVTRIVEAPLEAARRIAGNISKRSPEAVAGIKRLVDQTWTMGPGEGLRIEAEIQAAILGGANQIEAVMSNMQKRDPRFK